MNKTTIEWTDYTAGLIKSTHAGGPVSFDEWEARRILRTRTTGKRILMKGDPFEEDVPDEMLDRMFAVFALRPDLVFQVLTKRPERMREYMVDPDRYTCVDEAAAAISGESGVGVITRWPLPNVWLGVSVEDQAAADERIPALLDTPAAVRFLSCEPLLEPVDLEPWLRRVATSGPGWRMTGGSAMAIADIVLDWVIVGGESGPGARPCDVGWIRDIVQQCKAAAVPVFVKQLGARPLCIDTELWERDGRSWETMEPTGSLVPMKIWDRKGGDMHEWPEDLRVREFPS